MAVPAIFGVAVTAMGGYRGSYMVGAACALVSAALLVRPAPRTGAEDGDYPWRRLPAVVDVLVAGLTLAPLGGKIDPERPFQEHRPNGSDQAATDWRPEPHVVWGEGQTGAVACAQPGDRSTVPERS